MIFGNTRVDVLRTTSPAPEDGFGDPVETDDVALAGLPVDVEETTRRRFDPAQGKMVTLSGFAVAIRASCPFVFQPTDRLKNLRTGEVLQVETIESARGGWRGNRRVLFCTESA